MDQQFDINLLVAKMASGDREAFNSIYNLLSESIFNVAHRYVGDDMACDVVHDVFLKMWEQRKKFVNIVSIKTYLYNSVKNHCLNIIRHSKVNLTYVQKQINETYPEAIFDEEIYVRLKSAIDNLPAVYREVMSMSYYGNNVEEIAVVIGRSVESVRGYKKRGKKILQEQLKDLFFIIGTLF